MRTLPQRGMPGARPRLKRLEGEKFVRVSESQLKDLDRRVPGRLWPWALTALMWVTGEEGEGEYRRGLVLGGKELRARDFAEALGRGESTAKKRLAELERIGFMRRDRGQHGSQMWVLGFQKFEYAPASDVPATGGPSEGGAETDNHRGVPLEAPDVPATGGPSGRGGAESGMTAQAAPEDPEALCGTRAEAAKEVGEQNTGTVKVPLRSTRPGSAGRPPLAAEAPPAAETDGRSHRESLEGTAAAPMLSRDAAAALDDYPGRDRCDLGYEEWREARKAYQRRRLMEARHGEGNADTATGEQKTSRYDSTSTEGEGRSGAAPVGAASEGGEPGGAVRQGLPVGWAV